MYNELEVRQDDGNNDEGKEENRGPCGRAKFFIRILGNLENSESEKLTDGEEVEGESQVGLQAGCEEQRAKRRAEAHEPSGSTPHFESALRNRSREGTAKGGDER